MKKSQNAQKFVPVKEVRSGVAIREDGVLISILMVSSLNFALKSADEQSATIRKFQGFLNSLEFPTQISVQSRKWDSRPYIALLEETRKEQTRDLIKIQTSEYIAFIKNFTESIDIMKKSFFIVVSYSPVSAEMKKGGMKGINFLLGKGKKEKKQDKATKDDSSFEEARSQLEQRVNLVSSGISSCGIRLAQLDTEEIIEFLYHMFNPGEDQKPISLESQV